MNARRNNLFKLAFANQVALIRTRKIKYLRHGNLKSERTIIDTNDAMEAYWLAAKRVKLVKFIIFVANKKKFQLKKFLQTLISFSTKNNMQAR